MAKSDKITADDVSVKRPFQYPIEDGKRLLSVYDELKESLREYLKLKQELLQGPGGKGSSSKELKEILNRTKRRNSKF
jgi:hypothetical protein